MDLRLQSAKDHAHAALVQIFGNSLQALIAKRAAAVTRAQSAENTSVNASNRIYDRRMDEAHRVRRAAVDDLKDAWTVGTAIACSRHADGLTNPQAMAETTIEAARQVCLRRQKEVSDLSALEKSLARHEYEARIEDLTTSDQRQAEHTKLLLAQQALERKCADELQQAEAALKAVEAQANAECERVTKATRDALDRELNEWNFVFESVNAPAQAIFEAAYNSAFEERKASCREARRDYEAAVHVIDADFAKERKKLMDAFRVAKTMVEAQFGCLSALASPEVTAAV